MGITFSSPTPPLRKESPQPQYDTLSSFPLLATGNSISPYPDTARRRLATVAQQHASRQQQQDNDHSDLARRNTTHLRQPQNRHNWHRRQSEPAPVRAGVQRKGKGEDLGEVSGFMKAMNGEGGVWRLTTSHCDLPNQTAMGNTLTRLKEWFHEKLHTEEEQERHRQQLRAEEPEREQAWDEIVRDWDALQEEAAEVGWIFLEGFEEWFRQWRPRLS